MASELMEVGLVKVYPSLDLHSSCLCQAVAESPSNG